MPRPFATRVVLSPEQRETLIALIRARSTPQAMVHRCRIVLCSAEPQQPTNRHTVGQWRERYVAHGLAGLQAAPRSGRPRNFSPDERLHVITLASSKTADHQQPDSSWTLDNLAFAILHSFRVTYLVRWERGLVAELEITIPPATETVAKAAGHELREHGRAVWGYDSAAEQLS